MVQTGNNSDSAVAYAIGLTKPDYVVIDDGSIWSREDLWESLKQSLIAAVAARVSKPRKGRPAKGPAASLADDPDVRSRRIREAYDKITKAKGRPAQYVEVAGSLVPPISTTTLWRWRRRNGWPPPEVSNP